MRRHLMALAGLAIGFLLLIPSGASAWYVKLDSFFGAQQGSFAKQVVEARKCRGGKAGVYDFQATVISGSDDIEIFHRVTGKLSMKHEWGEMRKVDLTLEVPDTFDPDITAQILDAFGKFYDSIETKFVKGDMKVRHGPLIVFGNTILTEGSYAQDFKPKDKCPEFFAGPDA